MGCTRLLLWELQPRSTRGQAQGLCPRQAMPFKAKVLMEMNMAESCGPALSPPSAGREDPAPCPASPLSWQLGGPHPLPFDGELCQGVYTLFPVGVGNHFPLLSILLSYPPIYRLALSLSL